MSEDIKDWWEEHAQNYQNSCNLPIDIHYGPGTPNEDNLNLLGELKDKDVLELGCGGAQCSIAFALRGARVTGLDISIEQIQFARNLATEKSVEIKLMQHDISDLSPIGDESQDIVFSAFALMYIEDRDRMFSEVFRVLRPGGIFAFSLDHPMFRKIDPETLSMVESYHENGPAIDDMGELGKVTIHRYNIGSLHQNLVGAGLVVEKIIEPDARIRYDYDPWFGQFRYYVPKMLDMVPPTIIFKSVKPSV
jgi:ubiquinone/menaquinone biosynthesis C-methylase UbiE